MPQLATPLRTIAPTFVGGRWAHLQQTIELLKSGPSSTQMRRAGALAHWRANRVFSYIEDNLADRILIAHLARRAGLSHGHLMRSFKVQFGITLRVYINCRRIVAAQHRMLTTDESLCEIALEYGMSDQSHFCRVFRRFVGSSPSRWRESQFDAQFRDDAPPAGIVAATVTLARS
jgi:AraC-like DNA-binding protein